MPLCLRWRNATRLPVEGDALRPDTLAALPASELARLPVPVGNGTAELGELFTIEGDGRDSELVLEGDLAQVSRIGLGMSAGRLTIRGDVGAHLGSAMTGGTIEVTGTVGDWAGAEMRGGYLRIRGRAGNHLGAAYPGSRRGMREGMILVEGPAGDEVGTQMRRGLIAIAGLAGDDLGHSLIAGSIFVFGAVGAHAGAGMKRGTLALMTSDQEQAELLPTFHPSGCDRPPFLDVYLRQLRAWAFPVPEAAWSAPLERFNGDLVVGGQGEIWIGRH